MFRQKNSVPLVKPEGTLTFLITKIPSVPIFTFTMGQIVKKTKKKREKIHTPNVKTIDELVAFLNTDNKNFAKTLIML